MSASSDFSSAEKATRPLDAWILLFARVAIAPLYLYSGVGKVMAFATTAGRLPGGADGFGVVLAAGAIAVELGCGVALLLGLFARSSAVALICFTVAATLMFHKFWGVPEAQTVMQTINFLKNLGLIGGLALIASQGAGSYSLAGALKRR